MQQREKRKVKEVRLCACVSTSAPPLFFLFFFQLTISLYHLLPNCTKSLSSYGVVYLAIDRQTGEEVAVKAMSKRRPKSTRERTLKKLVREAALQARVQHCSGVVKLLGAYEVRSFIPGCAAAPRGARSLFLWACSQ